MQKITTNEEIQELSKSGLVVDFYTDWCPPCKILAPIFEQVAQQNQNINFAKCNTEEAIELAAHYKVSSIPRLLFFKDGELLHTISGAVSEQVLQESVDTHLGGEA